MIKTNEELWLELEKECIGAPVQRADDIVTMRRRLGLTQAMLADIMRVPEEAVARWENEILQLTPSAKRHLSVLASIAKRVCSMFWEEEARRWFTTPNLVLDSRRPIELMAKPEDILRVSELIGRVEYGIYS